MKKHELLVPLGLLLCAPAIAQPQKGQFLLNLAGNGWASRSDIMPSRQYRFSTRLSGGYFLTDRFAVGVQATLDRNIVKYNPISPGLDAYKYVTRKEQLGVMARYYFPLGKKTAFFVQGGAGVQQMSVRAEHTESGTGNTHDAVHHFPTGVYAHVSPGFAWHVTKRFSLEATVLEIGYHYDARNPHDKHSFGMGNYFNARIGASFNLGAGKKKQALPE